MLMNDAQPYLLARETGAGIPACSICRLHHPEFNLSEIALSVE